MTIAVKNLHLHWLIGIVNTISNTAMLNQLEESLSCTSHALGTQFLYSSCFNVLPITNLGIENIIEFILFNVITAASYGGGQENKRSSYKLFNIHFYFHNFHVFDFHYQNFHFHKYLQVWRRGGYPILLL